MITFFDYMAVLGYMVSIASQHEYNRSEAMTLQEKVVKVGEQEACVALALPLDISLNGTQGQQLSNLAGSLCRLGNFRAEVGNARCVIDYEKAIAIFKRVGEKRAKP